MLKYSRDPEQRKYFDKMRSKTMGGRKNLAECKWVLEIHTLPTRQKKMGTLFWGGTGLQGKLLAARILQ